MKRFSLPNLQNNPQVLCNYIFNKRAYTLYFRWCSDFCLVDIYYLQDGEKIYILKGRPITINIDLISRIKNNSLIEGKLTVENKYGRDNPPDQENFHTDFELVYYE